jgi:hypothetical protein
MIQPHERLTDGPRLASGRGEEQDAEGIDAFIEKRKPVWKDA